MLRRVQCKFMQKTANCSWGYLSFSLMPAYQPVYESKQLQRRLNSFQLPAQMLRKMKMLTVFLFAGFLTAHASGLSQTVSLSGSNLSLTEVFTSIKKQTGYVVFYNERLLLNTKRVSVDLHDAELSDLLDVVLMDQPLVYVIKEKNIILSRKAGLRAPAVSSTPSEIAFLMPVAGIVRDASGAPLVGATVKVKSKTISTITDNEGRFSLTTDPGDILQVSYVGFKTTEIKASPDYMQLTLELSNSKLDEIQVIAYGSDTKRFSVGSVGTVTSDDISKQPVSNLLLALQGLTPGLAINATSGVPGSRVQLQIRGQNTIRSGGWLRPYDQPLFIIDGVPFAPQNVNISQLSNLAMGSSFNGGISQHIGISPFSGINPSDIESVSILKDADATSIYGTQGSNGVVLITTKKGKAGKTNFNITANTNVTTAAHTVELMKTEQYLQLRKDAFAADGITPSANPNDWEAFAPDLLLFDQERYIDWQEYFHGNSTQNVDIHTSLSGGSYNNTFIISAGYNRNNFNYPGEKFADQRLSLHSGLHHASSNNKLTVDLGMDFSYYRNNSPAGNSGGTSSLLPPNLPDLLDDQRNLIWDYKGVSMAQHQFYSYLIRTTLLQNYNLNSSLRIKYHILPSLSFSVNMGYNRNTSDEHSKDPASAQEPIYASSRAQFAVNNFQTFLVEPQLDYNLNQGKSTFSALLGATYKKNITFSNSVQAGDYANDFFLGSINGAGSVFSYDMMDLYKLSAGFLRLKYMYDQKYILSLTGRRDGSSNFGPGHQFGNFGSIGIGWILSEETKFKAALPFISYSKLSASYGTNGSDGVASYLFQSFWEPIGYVPPFDGFKPNAPVNLFNPDYSWALKKSLNIAMDLGFFNDRILLNTTYYLNRQGNQLGGYPLPSQVGITQVLQNLPATVQNKGWEFSINSTNLNNNNFRWSTNFNISFNRNKLISFNNLENSSYKNEYIIGEPLSVIVGFRFKGINPATGLFEFYDREGKATHRPSYEMMEEGGDRTIISNREVKFMEGISNIISYKQLQLTVNFQFSSQLAPNYMQLIYQSSRPGASSVNLPIEVLNYWKQPGDQATFQKLSTVYSSEASAALSSFVSSSGAYSDNTYLRLKTLSISYSLPQKLMQKFHMQDCSIFMNTNNLLTFTNYKVGDPESFSFTGVPLQRTWAFGLNFNF